MAGKPMPLALMLPLDAALIAGSLLTFAYFHHVKPKDLMTGNNQPIQANIPSAVSTNNAVTTTLPDQTILTEKTDHTQCSVETDYTTILSGTSKTSAAEKDETTAETTDDGASQAPEESGDSTRTDRPATKTTAKPTSTTTTTTTAPPYDLSGWGYKWPSMFSLHNEVEVTDHSYRSHDLVINIGRYQYADSNCCVADIYIRDIRNFTYAFARDEAKTGIAENIASMMDRHAGILAINGDYFGVRDNGHLIRDGYCYRDAPRGDVAALYYDGTVETYSRDEFDLGGALASGIWQSFAFGPNLICDGYIQGGWTSAVYTEKHPRSGFGYYEPGHYCFVTVDGRGMGGSAGMTAEEFADFFGSLGCYQAYNLDGGKSSQMYFNGQIVNFPDGYTGDNRSLRELTDIFIIKEVR